MAPVPAVSCVMLTFNFERFVADALDSVLAQDHPADRLAITVVDNGSTDGTRDVLARYADRVDARLIDNVPVNAAIDVCLDAAGGDYVSICSGDDLWPRDKVSHQVAWLEGNPEVGLLYGDMEVIDDDGATIAPSFLAQNGIRPRAGRLLGTLMTRNVVSGGSVMFRRSLLRAFHPIPPHAAWEDWWIATCAARVAQIGFTQQPTYRYRKHATNLAHGATGAKLAQLEREEIRFRRWLVRTVSPGEVSLDELFEATVALRGVIAASAARAGVDPAAVAPVEDADRRAAWNEIQHAMAETDPIASTFSLARALACDPHDSRPAEAFDAAYANARQMGLEARAAIVRPGELLAEARSSVVLADADEVVADPGLLSLFAREAGPDDDVTLALFCPGWDGERAAAELPAALERAGLDPERSPDMLALPVDDSLSVRCALAVGCESLLTRRPPDWPLGGLPRFAGLPASATAA